MLGKDASWIGGVKDTADVVSQEKPLEIGNKIWMHDPNRNKGLAWLLRNGSRVPTSQHVFGHLEDVPFSSWITFNGTTETSSQGTTDLVFEANASAKLGLGSRVFSPATDQIIRFAAAFDSDGITSGDVTRNYGRGVSTDYLTKGEKLFILPPAHEQGFTMQDGLSNAMTYKSFYTTEMSYPVQVTNVEKAEESRGGDPFKRALKKRIKQAKDQMEGEVYLGGQKNDTSTTHPTTASEGMGNWVTTNTYTANYISRLDFFDILAEWTANNHDGGSIHCSMAFKSMVANWAMQMSSITVPIGGQSGEGKLGLVVDTIKTPFGEFDLVDIDLFNQDPYLMGTVFFVPGGKRQSYRPLIHTENLDLRYYPVNRDEIHSHEGELYGVAGWEFFEEEMWAKLTGLDFTS